ncbi:hypothetical protein, partial [[Ruminococcus] lactaris]|uniref:hypothetical protein n=1 Tax=[Ruminococcus] lactaris TaxID=46228 RepID=UPI003FD7C6F2
ALWRANNKPPVELVVANFVMKHDEFQVKGHRFGNEVRALLRVNLRGAFLRCISKRRQWRV